VKVIVRPGAEDVKQQIAIFPKRSAVVGDADAVLSAGVALFRARVHAGDQLPTARGRIGVSLGLGIEVRGRSVAGVKLIDLWPARARMPGVGVDLPNGYRAAKIRL